MLRGGAARTFRGIRVPFISRPFRHLPSSFCCWLRSALSTPHPLRLSAPRINPFSHLGLSRSTPPHHLSLHPCLTSLCSPPSSLSVAMPRRAKKEQEATAADVPSDDEPKAKRGKRGGAKPAEEPALYEDPQDKLETADGKPATLKITSWNVDGIRAWVKKNALEWVREEDPDVLCLQETKCAEKSLPAEVLDMPEFPHKFWACSDDKEGYSGVALLSKKKPINVTIGIGMEEHDKEGRVITAEFDEYFVVAAYVPNSSRGLVRLDYRETWDIAFRTFLKELQDRKPLVLCGDLNVAHQEIDLKNPKTNKNKTPGFTQRERDGFTELLKAGFVDSFRHLYPEVPYAYTFWTYMMNARAKNVGWRLDYFVLSEALLPKLCDNKVRSKVMGSDHCPITLLLAM
ncbi:DNA repair nuclease/redox regulator APEX1 [Lampetra planeri]